MVADGAPEQNDQSTPGRPRFSRTEAPVGVYDGQQAIIVYDLRPLPLRPKYWIQALANQFRCQLNPAPKVDISVVDDSIRFAIFVSPEVSAEDLCKLDDIVYDTVNKVGRAIERGQADLSEKLDRVRKRRMDKWGESYFR